MNNKTEFKKRCLSPYLLLLGVVHGDHFVLQGGLCQSNRLWQAFGREGALPEPDAGWVLKARSAPRHGLAALAEALDHGLVKLVRVDAAHEVVLAVVLAEPQVAIGQHREGASAVGHALSHRNLGLDAAALEQARTFKPQVKILDAPGELLGRILPHGDDVDAIKLARHAAVGAEQPGAGKARLKVVHQGQEILSVGPGHIEPHYHADARVKQTPDVCEHHLVGALLAGVNVALDGVVDALGAVKRDLNLAKPPELGCALDELLVKEEAIGDHGGLVPDAALNEVVANEVNDLSVVQGLSTKPGKAHLVAATVAHDVVGRLVRGPDAHGRAGAVLLVAVEAARVAVHGGEDVIGGDVLGPLVEGLQHQAHEVRRALVVYARRNAEPAFLQLKALVRAAKLLRREERELARQRVEGKGALPDLLEDQVVGPPPAVRRGLGLAQDLEHVGYRFLDGLHENLPSCFVEHARQAKHLLAQHARGG